MGNRSTGLFVGLVLVALLGGCVTAAATKKPEEPINKVALVSLSVANWRGMVTGTAGSNSHAADLIEGTLSHLLVESEAKLAGTMRVVHVSSFAGSPGYRRLGVKNELQVMLPKVNGHPLEVFTTSNDELIAAALKPEVAKKLCADLGVDAVVVIYSEWAWAQGHFVPTRRALTKDVVSVWDRHGNLVFNKRIDETGTAVIGGPYGPIVVNEGTIKQWSGAYIKAFEEILTEMKATLKS